MPSAVLIFLFETIRSVLIFSSVFVLSGRCSAVPMRAAKAIAQGGILRISGLIPRVRPMMPIIASVRKLWSSATL